MAQGVEFPGWNWEDPDKLAVRLDEFSEGLARCESLKALDGPMPRSRGQFAALGVTGIEFAAFRTEHPAGLGSDLAPLRAGDETAGYETTEPGRVYRVDGGSLFTQLDIADPLPFDDGCVDWVYAEHLIEHVPLPVAIRWLAEVRRVLAPGGLLRLTTPDLAGYVEGYRAAAGGFFAKHRRRLRMMRVGPPMPERRAFMFNQIFYLYGHRWIYDLDELRYAVSEAGFAPDALRECAFREGSRQDVAELDTTFRNDETIYVEVNA